MSLLRLCNNDSSYPVYNDVAYQQGNFTNQKNFLDSLDELHTNATTDAHDTANKIIPSNNNNAFGIGSSVSKVLEAQGNPTNTNLTADGKEIFYYGKSDVVIETDIVIGFENVDNNLNLSLSSSTTPVNHGLTFTIGSSKNIVLALQGLPSSVKRDLSGEYEWQYGNSYVWIKDDIVSNYLDVGKNLKVVR